MLRHESGDGGHDLVIVVLDHVAIGIAVLGLVERLDDERTERERLDSELQQVRATLVALERRLETVTVNTANVAQVDAAGDTEADAGRSRRVDADRLVDAGFDVEARPLQGPHVTEADIGLFESDAHDRPSLRSRSQRNAGPPTSDVTTPTGSRPPPRSTS